MTEKRDKDIEIELEELEGSQESNKIGDVCHADTNTGITLKS